VAVRYDEYLTAGAIAASISVDSVGQNAAMARKLDIPFALLADPDRSEAIEPYGLADPKDARNIAIPATIVVDPDGEPVWRRSSHDFADRPDEDEALDIVRELGLAATTQEPITPVDPEPGPRAMPFELLTTYFRGAKFAATAMGRRFPVARDNAAAYGSQMDQYIEAVHAVRLRREG
jgi:alkyl hydroperoxide reductase subunit AhpC